MLKYHVYNWLIYMLSYSTLQKLKYDILTNYKLPLESYQNRIWYDSNGNLVAICEYHTSVLQCMVQADSIASYFSNSYR